MFYLLLYLYLTTIGVAFISSLVSVTFHFPKHLQWFSFFLGLSFLVEMTANFIFPALHLNRYRNALYNVFSLVEFIFYAYFFYSLTLKQWIKKAQIFFMCLFPFIWAKLVFDKDGFYKWHGDQIAIGGFFMVCFALLFIYHLADTEEPIALSKHAEFWIAIGLVLYYSCETPFMGTLKYLSSHYLSLAKLLLKVSMVINSIMYCLFTYAFLCRNRKFL